MRLEEYFALTNLSEREFARKLKISHAHISNIIKGRRNASIPLAKKIETLTNGKVKMGDLYNPSVPSKYNE